MPRLWTRIHAVVLRYDSQDILVLQSIFAKAGLCRELSRKKVSALREVLSFGRGASQKVFFFEPNAQPPSNELSNMQDLQYQVSHFFRTDDPHLKSPSGGRFLASRRFGLPRLFRNDGGGIPSTDRAHQGANGSAFCHKHCLDHPKR